LTKAAEAKLKAKEKKKRGIKDSDDDMDGDDDAYTAPSRLMRDAASAETGPRPAPGSFEVCVKCEKRFTVTVYTMAAVPGPGWLCHPCAKATGNDPFKKPQGPRKKKLPADKRVITSFEERRFPSLVSLCVQLITKYIDDVESLGDIGTLNVEAISKALSKNRSLTSENVQLFYNVANTTLTLYDATNLSPDAFQTLAFLNPNLTTLRLDFCGQINDEAFNTMSSSLPALTELELLGPFLVRPPSWINFFATHPNLERFLITQSPRFDLECLETLISSCGSSLQELRLKEIGKIDDEFLQELSRLGSDDYRHRLTYLDLSDPGESCGEEAMIDLLSALGPELVYLNLSNHILLTDAFLSEGILPHTRILRSLILNNLPELTDRGVASFFESWSNNPPLVSLDLSRNHLLADNALTAILEHSGEALEELNVNGWRHLSEDVLISLAIRAPELRKADVGWVRDMTDFVVKAWVDGTPQGGVETKLKGGKEEKDPNAMQVDTVVVRTGGCKKPRRRKSEASRTAMMTWTGMMTLIPPLQD
ncbi:DNA repair protein rhp7, partial [Leucoagaricus sp. SymC.cos]